MVESDKKLRKRKEHEEREVEGLIGSENQADNTKKRRLDPPAVSEDEQAREDQKRGKQERKAARAEKRRLKALRRDKSGEGLSGRTESQDGVSEVGQALATTNATDRRSGEDVQRRKNNQKRATPPPAQLLPVPALAKASETAPASQNSLKTKQKLSSEVRAKKSQDIPLTVGTQNAEASSSRASQVVASSKNESKEAKQKRIDTMSHEELLSSVWLNTAQLKEKVETEGAFRLTLDCVIER
jgi:hypothetical protein